LIEAERVRRQIRTMERMRH